ncbi:hypothetical protein [Streptomyces sp. NBC_01013]|nr:hypothetical protein OG538_00090 [Streptomyces sp. NBC_01013]
MTWNSKLTGRPGTCSTPYAVDPGGEEEHRRARAVDEIWAVT